MEPEPNGQSRVESPWGGTGFNSGMTAADDYRRMADECLVLAEQCENPGDRLRLLEMARAWRELAEKISGGSNALRRAVRFAERGEASP